MLAYCVTLGLRAGHLVYAKGNETPAVHEVRNVRIAIHCHALDLSLKPNELLAQIAALAEAIRASSAAKLSAVG